MPRMGVSIEAILRRLLTTTGDIIAASAVNTPARIAAPASGLVLTGQGAGVLPAWAAGGGGYTQGARVYNSAAIVISTATATALTFNTENYDTDTIHSTVSNTNRLTCVTAGKYLIVGHATFAANATGVRQFGIYLNNTSWLALIEHVAIDATYSYSHPVVTIYDLAATDYVEFKVYQNSGGNLNIVANAGYSPYFMMQRIG